MIIIGADFGTGYIKIAYLDRNGHPQMLKFGGGDTSLMSCVYIDMSGIILLGFEAFCMMLCDPSRGVLFWKRHIGTDEIVLEVDGKKYKAKDILKIYIEHVKKVCESQTGDILKQMVMTVPANYNDHQKKEVRKAAESCGVEVLKLEHEPTASLLSNYENNRAPGYYCIVDVGAGTTDITIAEISGDSITVKGTSGVPKLGGMDFSNRVVQHVLDAFKNTHGIVVTEDSHPQEYQEIFQRAEKAKCALSEREKTVIVAVVDGQPLSVEITRDQFNDMCKDLIGQVVDAADKALSETAVSANQVNTFVPVGGGSLVSGIADAIEERFGQRPTSRTDVHHSVAQGAVIAARLDIESRGEVVVVDNVVLPPLSMITRDVTAHAIGVTVLKESDQGLYNSVILRKGIPFPSVEFPERFKLADRDQTDAVIEILQGPHGARKDECQVLGTFELNGLSRVTDPGHEHIIIITMKLDKDGVLTARARDSIDGIEADLQVEYSNKAN